MKEADVSRLYARANAIRQSYSLGVLSVHGTVSIGVISGRRGEGRVAGRGGRKERSARSTT